MMWQDSNQLTCTLETVFNQILDQRMCGLPLLNHALSVEVAGFNPVNDEWVGILITPWFMNLLLMPRQDCSWSGLHMGAKFEKSFPYGVFEFTLAVEERLGTYAQCSLFSPMFQFATQADALATAQSALQALMVGEMPPNAHNLSRRNFLSGQLGNNGRV